VVACRREEAVNNESLWSNYLEAFRQLVHSRMALHGHQEELVESIRRSLLAPGWDCPAALSYFAYLPTEVALRLVDTVILVALSVHGNTVDARSVLSSMPRPEVTKAVENEELRVVDSGDYEEWGCLLALWDRLGERQRAEDLANRGLLSNDEDIRDMAARFLEDKGSDSSP
jgi:hypothetical protein